MRGSMVTLKIVAFTLLAALPCTGRADNVVRFRIPEVTLKEIVTLARQDGTLVLRWAPDRKPEDLGDFQTTKPALSWTTRVYAAQPGYPPGFALQGTSHEKEQDGVQRCTISRQGESVQIRVYFSEKSPMRRADLFLRKGFARVYGYSYDPKTSITKRDLMVTATSLDEILQKEPERARKYLKPLIALFTSEDLLATPATQPATAPATAPAATQPAAS